MSFRAYAQSLEIPRRHIDALRSVDLQLYLGYHGEARSDIAGKGPGVLMVTDGEYGRIADAVTSMQASRGDVLAVETAGFRHEWDSVPFLMSILHRASRSIYSNSSMTDIGPLSSPDPDKLSVLAQELRRFQIIGPVAYGQLLAMIQGIPSRNADATRPELREWRRDAAEQWNARSRLSRLAIGKSVYGLAEDRFREGRMVSRLGTIAANIARSSASPPRIVFAGGGAHGRGVRGILEALDIPYLSHNLHPYPRIRTLAIEALTLGNWLLPSLIKDSEKLWLRHTAAEAKESKL